MKVRKSTGMVEIKFDDVGCTELVIFDGAIQVYWGKKPAQSMLIPLEVAINRLLMIDEKDSTPGEADQHETTYHQRELTDTRNLDDLVNWLRYGKQSSYVAARCSKVQEEYWAHLLEKLLVRQVTSKQSTNEGVDSEATLCSDDGR